MPAIPANPPKDEGSDIPLLLSVIRVFVDLHSAGEENAIVMPKTTNKPVTRNMVFFFCAKI